MKVPLSWLREYVDVRVEPGRLAEALTLSGLAVDGIEQTEGDAVLDIDVTTNRVDCMNVYGVAREVAALFDLSLRPLELGRNEAGEPAEKALRVTIAAGELCPRFCARVLDVRVGPSPAEIRHRLDQVGVRPINNVVDLTNYVMMEMGQPSHAFDLARIPEGRLQVRWAHAGETLTTLDGVSRTLEPTMGVVAGPEKALALAGVMGGASSEVSAETTTVALEAAYWDPPAIRRTAKALGMHTEASHRFERGADPEAPASATARIAHLLERIGAGRSRPGLIEALGTPRERRTLKLRTRRVEQVLGAAVPDDRLTAILRALGFAATPPRDGEIEVIVPSWRGDVTREIDLVEEVARHHGLDKIAPTLPAARLPGGLRPFQWRERRLRELLRGAGLSEAVNLGLVDDRRDRGFGDSEVRLANPLSSDLDVLRGSLLPGLLGNLETNFRQGRRDVALFEIGRVFAASNSGEPLPREVLRLGMVLTGSLRPPHWSERPAPADFFTVKGLVEAFARRLGMPPLDASGRVGLPPFLHPGRSAVLSSEGGPLGLVGAVHRDLQAKLDAREEVVVAELLLEPWLQGSEHPLRVRALDRFPAVSRDLSLLCDERVSAADLVSVVRSAGGAALRSVEIRDRYVGERLPPGKMGLTIGLRFQDAARTLTGEEVQGAVDQVVAALREAGAEIRSE
jgi:phenylalanyl-tRNA synthetase beta chain